MKARRSRLREKTTGVLSRKVLTSDLPPDLGV